MFKIELFTRMDEAAERMYDLLESSSLPPKSIINVCHSINGNECNIEEVDIETFHHVTLDFLRDLDAQEGLVVEGESGFDFIDTPEKVDKYYGLFPKTEDGELFVCAGEGIACFYNSYAIHPHGFPLIIVKRSLHNVCEQEIIASLQSRSAAEEYTSKIAPAIFVEIC